MAKVKTFLENTKENWKKKQWAKYVSKGISLALMRYNKESLLYKAYKNTSFCVDNFLVDEVGNVQTRYCKNRWCSICNRIKTAKLINGYLPAMEKMFSPVFVTLTLPTCEGEKLKGRIKEMEEAWRNIYNNTKKPKFKKTYPNFKGIRKAEITLRPNENYHYHYHIIIDNWAVGEWLIGQWLKKFPQASEKAQDIRFANEFSYKELFKYAIKSELKTNNPEDAKRYNLVFLALRGKRTYQPFGGITAINEEFDEEDLKAQGKMPEFANDILEWVIDDWYSKNTGLALIGEEIPEKVKKMTI